MEVSDPIVIHYVYDMERARRFYCAAFDVVPSFESPGWTTLDLGAIELALHILYPGSAESERPLPHAGLNLKVDDIESIQAIIERHGGALLELRDVTPSSRSHGPQAQPGRRPPHG